MAYDILLGEDGDLAVTETGDLLVDWSDAQHVDDLLLSNRGNWKQYPLAGAAIQRLANSKITGSDALTAKRLIAEALRYDDVKLNKLTIATDGTIKLDSTRNEL